MIRRYVICNNMMKNNTSIETINGLKPVAWVITEAEGRVVVLYIV